MLVRLRTQPALTQRCACRGLINKSDEELAALGRSRRLDGLPLVWSRCPNLRELELRRFPLSHPAGPLAQLTRLTLDACCRSRGAGAPPLLRLKAAAPRLGALGWRGTHDDGAAEAAAGHPALRELSLNYNGYYYSDKGGEPERAWLRAAPRLAAVTSLSLVVGSDLFERDEDMGGQVHTGEWLQRVCQWTEPWRRLQHLQFAVTDGLGIDALLAAAGGAAGGRLRSLTLALAELPAARAEAASALRALGAAYPLLEVLTLQLGACERMEVCTAMEVSGELLRSAAAIAPSCPALREVRVEPSLLDTDFSTRGIPRAGWRRPGAA